MSYFWGYKNGMPETYELELSIDDILGTDRSDNPKWMIDDPIRYKLGKYFLMLPNNKSAKDGSVAIFYMGGFPFLMAQDLNQDGVPDELTIRDSAGKSLAATIEDKDALDFDASYSTVSGTPGIDAITYIDENFDGRSDMIYSDEEGIKRLP